MIEPEVDETEESEEWWKINKISAQLRFLFSYESLSEFFAHCLIDMDERTAAVLEMQYDKRIKN